MVAAEPPRRALDAVDEFLAAFNARDPARWSASLNYPHIRLAPGQREQPIPDAATHTAGVRLDALLASGWDHSEWDYRRMVQVAPGRVHVAGQWSRYDAGGRKLLDQGVVYVVTLLDGHWGVQARFAVGSPADDGAERTEQDACRAIQAYAAAHNAGNVQACAALLDYPHTAVEIGRLQRTQQASDFSMAGTMRMEIEAMMAVQTGRLGINMAIEVGMTDATGLRHPWHGALLFVRTDGALRIAGWSFLRG